MKLALVILCILLAIVAYNIVPAYLEAVGHRNDTPAERVNRIMEGDGTALRESAGQSPAEIALTPGVKARILFSLLTAFLTHYWYLGVAAVFAVVVLMLRGKRITANR